MAIIVTIVHLLIFIIRLEFEVAHGLKLLSIGYVAVSINLVSRTRPHELTEVADGSGPEVLNNGNGDVGSSREDFVLVLVEVILVLVFLLVLVDVLASLASLALLLLDDKGSLGLFLGNLAASEAEETEEGNTAEASVLHLLDEGLLGGALVGRGDLTGLLVVVDLLGQAKHATGQILLLRLPLDFNRLGNETGPAVLGVAPPELLLEDGVLEEFVLLKLELDGDAAGIALGQLEALDREVLEVVDQSGRVNRLDELVNLRGSLGEDERPEVGDLGNKLLALGVEVLGQGVLLTDYAGLLALLHISQCKEEHLRISTSTSSKSSSRSRSCE